MTMWSKEDEGPDRAGEEGRPQRCLAKPPEGERGGRENCQNRGKRKKKSGRPLEEPKSFPATKGGGGGGGAGGGGGGGGGALKHSFAKW